MMPFANFLANFHSKISLLKELNFISLRKKLFYINWIF